MGKRAGFILTNQHRRLAARRGSKNRFAQGAGRDHAAIAEAIGPINDQQGQCFCEGRVLQPIIHDDRLRPGRLRGCPAGCAIRGYPGGAKVGQQQSLIPHGAAVMGGGVNPHRALQLATIAAQQEMSGQAACLKPLAEI